MQTQKMSLANIKGKLSRAEMKNIMAGSNSEKCIPQHGQNCSTSGGGNPEDQCCTGFKCEMNATSTGTICT